MRVRRSCSWSHASASPPTPTPLDSGVLDGCDLLVIAHPSDPRWERTTGIGSPQLSDAEQDAIHDFVQRRRRPVVLGETEQDKYGNNVNELLERFELRLRSDTVQDYEHCDGAPTWIHAELRRRRARQRRRPAGRRERRLLLPRDDDREPQRRPRLGAHAPLGIGAGGAVDRRRPSTATGRVVVLGRLGPVRRRLHRLIRPRRTVAEHRRLGGPAVR